MLKEPTSIYRPGMRSPAWLKVKPKVTLEVVVTGGSSEAIQWGDWGLAGSKLPTSTPGMGNPRRYGKPSVSGVMRRLPYMQGNGPS